ncbi:hypothetical protein KUTeg_019993 [Tegillarca granosa]|uniref:Cyclic nucleotide-binding domain-containing protein n=1 Tax=Tegillarca granosa TaxID=220873 RepID=A0ABQ9EJ55_TEGGR|nr:hypothetical protein KUTeg_019993 [Tegillarca granosa]
MALVKLERSLSKPVWGGNHEKKNTLPKIEGSTPHPTIDYEKLRWLCEIDGLKGRNQEYTTEEAHEIFMTNYKDIFVKPPKKLGFPVHFAKRGETKSSTASITNKATGKTTEEDVKLKRTSHKKEYPIDTITHDIRDYLPLLHKQRKSEHPEAVRADNIKTLRRLLRKLPFERTAAENDKIFSILKTFPFFQENTPDNNSVSLLCLNMFGNTGLHMVLKGKVAPLTEPVLCGLEPSGIDSRCPTPVLTKEPVLRIDKREHTEKINLLLACGQYKLWPQQPLHQVAELFEWISYPPNTECHVLRQVDVIQTLRNLKREKKTKQVVMGKLVDTQSFAEMSVLLDEPMTCSVVTATNVKLGIIRPERIKELDEDDIQQEYIKQELKREWNEFKHKVVVESINAQGIRPGYGKWAK